MPVFTLHRNHVVRSKGHAIAFEKGVKTHVPRALVEEVIAIGGVPVDEDIETLLPEDEQKKEEPQDEEREAVIFKAIKDVVLNGAREDFGGNGAPTVQAVSKIVGFKVDKKEYAELYKKYQEENGS